MSWEGSVSLSACGKFALCKPANFLRTLAYLCWMVAASMWLGFSPISEAEALPNAEYQSKLRIRPCQQFFSGQASIALSYRQGTIPTRFPIAIQSQSVDTARREVTLFFSLPRTLGQTKMHLEAFCQTPTALSRPSNILSVSNCDFLATEDNDHDGLPNSAEDTNCDNFFSPGDKSNPDNLDTDGDGVRDLVERVEGFDPANPGSSPRPYIFAGGSFDPDGDGNSNPVVWRPQHGTWYIRDFVRRSNHLAIQFGLPGDTPFTYKPSGQTADVGVVRRSANELLWILNGPGLQFSDGHRETIRRFGLFGDNLIPGPWENSQETSIAVARLFNDHWSFYILKKDNTVRQVVWGGNGDVPKVQDYDGDGIFDIAVFRPSEGTYYIIRSSDGLASVVQFGTGTADHTVRGDISGDGVDDMISWEPSTGLFTAMIHPSGLGRSAALYEAVQLGLYYVHLPLSWNRQDGRTLFTVVDHATGLRYIRPGNDPSQSPFSLQWGLRGDAQG